MGDWEGVVVMVEGELTGGMVVVVVVVAVGEEGSVVRGHRKQ